MDIFTEICYYIRMLDVKKLQEKTPEELIQIIFELNSNLNYSEKQRQELQEKLKLLLSKKYTKKAEDSNQLDLAFDEPKISESEQQEIDKLDSENENNSDIEITVNGYTRKKTGRKPLPANLPRKDIIHDLSEEQKKCECGCIKKCIGEDVTEQLEYIPASTYVNRHIRLKYSCKGCDEAGIVLASMPKKPIPKSIAGPGLLAQILVAKYCYHLPLYRQETILRDAGVDISRATTSSWVIKCSELLKPLVNLMQDNILDYDVSYADETRVQVLNELERKAEQQSFMWCFAGGSPTKFSIVFQYSPTRNHSIPLEFFGTDYEGYLHCDGYSAYETMAKKNKAILVGCMLHARRKFMDIAKASLNHELGLSHQAIKFFKKLTKIEHDIKNNKFDKNNTKAYRKQHTIPILDEFKIWLDKNIQLVPPRFPIGIAIQYTLNQWPKLIKYLEDGRLEWSNNFSERIMKAFATGRKNWRVPLARNQPSRKEVMEASAA